jgi:hypothetical protein
MTNSVAVAVARNETVVVAIDKANAAMKSVLSYTRSAAKAAAEPVLAMSGSLPDRVAATLLAYAEDLAKVDHNIKAIFTDCLWLLLAPATAISIEGEVDGKKADVQTTAEKAVDMSKHKMRAAAKQVREAAGVSRESGGGRKPAQPVTAPEQVTADTEELAFAAWLSNVPVYAGDKTKAPRIVAAFEDIGITFKIVKK